MQSREALSLEIERLRAELIEERRTATRLLDDHGRACVRAEQAEDGAEKAKRDRDALLFTQTSGTYAICAKHPRIFSPDKRMPCPACERDAAIARADRLLLEAQIHACEARTANAAIREIYQICTGATGEPGTWNGAEPVRELKAAKERAEGLLQAAWDDPDYRAKRPILWARTSKEMGW